MIKNKTNYAIETSLTVKDLVEAGAHFGHQTRKWHPKVAPYIVGEKNSIYIIDIAKTLASIRAAGKLIAETIKNKQSILFVGTKRQAKDVVELVAKDCEEFFVSERWTGGLLTNPSSRSSVEKIYKLEETLANPENGLKKKEVSKMTKKKDKIFKVFKGIMNMDEMPGLMIVVDIRQESLAVSEAKKLNIPTICLVDTNGNPEEATCPIVVNDDSVKSISAVLGELGEIIKQTKRHLFGSKEIAEEELRAKLELDSE